MSPYSRVISVYERFTVMSTAAIRQEVQALVGASNGAALPPLVRDVCELLVKSGEWRRALVVADTLSPAQRGPLMTALGLTNAPPQLHAAQPEQEAADVPLAMELGEMTTEALLKLGFALQRPRQQRGRATPGALEKMTGETRENTTASSKHNAVMQRQLFLEFRRRRQYKELMQCVMNWRSKGLIPTRRVARRQAEGSDASEEKSDAHCTEGSSNDIDGAVNAEHFNAEEALRGLIFHSLSGSQWEEALREFPEFFVATLREPTAALQFLRKTSVEVLTRFTLSLLRNGGGGGAFFSPQPATTAETAHSRPERRVPWETVAALCFALRPHLAQEKKIVKMDLLQAVLEALRDEASAGVDRPGVGRGVGPRRTTSTAAAVTDARSQAMRSAVEGLCASLTHYHEAQARFIGLSLFIEIAVALRDCGVRVPNALVQCIFLCLGDAQRYQWDETTSLGSWQKSLFLSGNCMPLERELLVSILSSSPVDRWIPALRLLHVCNEQRSFVVTSAHLRSVLGGLQSISIRRTWQAALCAAQSIMTQYHIFPDEASVEKLMLNLHAASWRRSFEVLQLYRKNHILPSPLIMRDLHVIAMKHSSWDVVLRVMQQIEEVGSQCAGFMNHVYCLRAYGCAGKWEEAATLFCDLKNKPGAVDGGRSAYNEVTVAVPVMGMIEHEHWESVVRFVTLIRHRCGSELTREGRRLSHAAELLALVHAGDPGRVAAFLNRHSGDTHDPDDSAAEGLATSPPRVAELRDVVLGAARLQTLRGMEHLNAPIRLAFDIVAAPADGDRRWRQAEQIGPAERGGAGRRPLFLPPQHVKAQNETLAVMFAAMMRRDEALFGAAAQRAVAEAMTAAGAGPAFLKAAFL